MDAVGSHPLLREVGRIVAAGRGAAWLARLTGGQKVGGSNPPGPTQTVVDADRLLTVPNLLSLLRILFIPVFVALLLRPGSELVGLLTLGLVTSTDWVDGFVARRTGRVSKLGKLLDPVADRLAIAAALFAFLLRGALPPWAVALVVIREIAVSVATVVAALRFRSWIAVRWLGKASTFALMVAMPALAWGHFELPLARFARVTGWVIFWPGLAAYYITAFFYLLDFRRALDRHRGREHGRGHGAPGRPGLRL